MSEDSKTGSPPTTGKQHFCKLGCGFFGSEELSGCCSQCWKSDQRNAIQDPSSLTPKSKADFEEHREKTSLNMCLLRGALEDKAPRDKHPLPLLPSSISFVGENDPESLSDKQEVSLKRKHSDGDDNDDDTKNAFMANVVIKKRKQKKKGIYSAILSNILSVKEKSTVNDELNLVRQGLGGGAFTKVAKI